MLRFCLPKKHYSILLPGLIQLLIFFFFFYDESRRNAVEILNLFDNDIGHIINGTDIDRPRNASILIMLLH